MLARISIRKIMVSTLALFALLLLYLIPENEETQYTLSTDDVEYIYTNQTSVVYLLDSNNYVARTSIKGCDCNKEEEAKEILETLIVDGKNSNTIPNGFRPIIPSGTEIKNIIIENEIITIDFSKEFFDINQEYEEKMIETIVYSMTNIEGIEKVTIKVEGEILTKLPKSNKIINKVLDRSFGINKTYNLTQTNNIDSYTVYYVSNYNDNYYYVPVTKYVNNTKEDKVKVIIDELSTSPIHETNLISYLDSKTSLIDYNLENETLKLNFNNYILSDNSNKILEEVVYTISLSLQDTYNVKEVSFLVENQEIYKKSLKTLE